MLLKKITHLQLKHSRQTRRYAHSEALKPGVCVCVRACLCVCVRVCVGREVHALLQHENEVA